jgi:hypothetical protein
LSSDVIFAVTEEILEKPATDLTTEELTDMLPARRGLLEQISNV